MPSKLTLAAAAAIAAYAIAPADAFAPGASLHSAGARAGARSANTIQMMAAEAKIRLGTRGSPLALAQAYETRRRLAAAFPEELGKEAEVRTTILICFESGFFWKPLELLRGRAGLRALGLFSLACRCIADPK